MESYSDLCNGWTGTLNITTTTPLDRCAAAFNVFTGSPIVHDTINFKTITDDFRLLADHHKQINSFGFGNFEDLSYWTESRLKQQNTTFESPYFPLLYVIPSNSTSEIQENGSSWTEFTFNCVVMDICNRDDSNQVDVLSDTAQILDDIISQFRLSVSQSLGCFNAKYYLDDAVEITPFIEEYSDLTAGWNGILKIKTMMPLDRCAAAFSAFTQITPTITPTPSITPNITPTPSITPSFTPTQTQTMTPTPSTPVLPFNAFIVASGTSVVDACNALSSGITFIAYANIAGGIGQCAPCVPFNCFFCVNTSDTWWLDAAFTIPLPDMWLANYINPPSSIPKRQQIVGQQIVGATSTDC